MAAGDLTRAYLRTGGLAPLVGALQDIQQKKEQQDYYNNLLTAYNNSRNKMNQVGMDQLPVQNNQPIQGNTINGNQEKPINVQDRQPVQSNFNVLASPEKYREAQDVANNFLSSQLIGALKTPGVNTGAINALGGLLQNEAGQYMPKPHTYRNIAPGAMEIELDEYGRPTGKTIGNPKGYDKSRTYSATDNNGNPVTKTIGGKVYQKWITEYPSESNLNPTEDWKPVPNGSRTTINNPAPPPDISSNVKDLTNLQKNFEYWDNISKGKSKYYDSVTGKETQPDKGFIESQKQAAWDKVLAESDATANRLNSKYPGFERIYNALFQNSDIKNRKDIDKAIDEDMQGAPKDAIVQMKRLIHARVF